MWQLEMTLLLYWEDNRIFASWQNAGAGGFDPSDQCSLFWQPSLLWPSVHLDPHPDSTLEPSIIEDGGLTTIVGRAAPWLGDAPSRIVTNSAARRSSRVRGSFYAPPVPYTQPPLPPAPSVWSPRGGRS